MTDVVCGLGIPVVSALEGGYSLTGLGPCAEQHAEGLLAVCIQHEMDHLVGKVFVEYLSPLKRARLTSRLRKKQRLAG